MIGRPLAVLVVLALAYTEVQCSAAGQPQPLAAQFREAAARILEAGHGWINCLLSSRPSPPGEIIGCMGTTLLTANELLAELQVIGYAIINNSQEEAPKLRDFFAKMAELRTKLDTCVHNMEPSVRVAGNCYTVK